MTFLNGVEEMGSEGYLCTFFFFSFTLATGPRRSLSFKLSDTRVYEPHIRARLGTNLTHPLTNPQVPHGVPFTAAAPERKLPHEGFGSYAYVPEVRLLFFFITLKPRVEWYERL